jgi:hypothetical protein
MGRLKDARAALGRAAAGVDRLHGEVARLAGEVATFEGKTPTGTMVQAPSQLADRSGATQRQLARPFVRPSADRLDRIALTARTVGS